jgi:hypothetical protein
MAGSADTATGGCRRLVPLSARLEIETAAHSWAAALAYLVLSGAGGLMRYVAGVLDNLIGDAMPR